MLYDKNKVMEYLLYLLSLSFFVGKSYKVVAGLVVIVFLIDVFKNKRWEIFKDQIFIILALWCIYLFCSALWAENYIRTMIGSLEVFLWCLLYLSVKYTLTTNEQIDRFLRVQSVLAIFIVFNIVTQFIFGFNIFGIPIQGARVTDLFSGHDRMFSYIFPLWVALFGAMLASREQTKKRYILYAIALFGILLSIPLSGSRGALLLLVLFLPLIAWVTPLRKWAFIVLGALVVSSVLMVSTSSVLQARLKTLAHPFENQRHTRIPIWLTAIEMIKDNPIVGVGFKNFREREFEYYKDSFDSIEINPKTGAKASHAHNPWLDILSEQGVIGACFALLLLFTIAKMAYKAGTIAFIGSMGVWYSFSILNAGFVISSGTWSFFMILSITFFSIIVNYTKSEYPI